MSRCLHWPAPGREAGTVLLLHGLTSCAETWAFVAPELARRHRVLALDLRGHGDSGKPDHGYDFPTITADIQGVLDHFNVATTAVAGHSWGASIAVALAAALPERVDHAVMVDGGFLGPPRSQPLSEEQLENMLAPPRIYASRASYLDEVRRHYPGRWTPRLEAIALAAIYQNPDGSVREKLDRTHQKAILQQMFGQLHEGHFAAVRCPVLLVPAESNDPAAAERMATKRERVARTTAAMPAANVAWVRDTVHDIQLHRPDALLEALGGFLPGPGD